jgi:DNA-binding transcriptional MerR regulator
MSERWKIDELVGVVEEALRRTGQDGQDSARVRSVPDRRTIRYYTTLGLLDKPVEMRGRTAYYGRRHVLQLVVIKRLQARGLSLAQVQQSLAGADGRTLNRWAALPEGFWERRAAAGPSQPKPPSLDELLAVPAQRSSELGTVANRLEEPFWTVAPEARHAKAATFAASEESALPRAAMHLPVTLGVELVIEGIDWSNVSQDALAELAPALKSLQAALRRSGLVSPEQAPETPTCQQESNQQDQNNEEES